MKFKRSYEEKYKKGCFVRRELLPKTLPHFEKGVKIKAMELSAAGRGTLDGDEVEYHDFRVYVTVPK